MRAKGRVSPTVQSDDGRERAADEQRLEHHLIPRRLGKLLRRIRDCGAPRLRRRPACSTERLPPPAARSAADPGTAAGRDRTRRARPTSAALHSRSSLQAHLRAVGGARTEQVHAHSLVQRPVAGIPTRAARRRGREIRVGEGERCLADLPRDGAHQQVEIAIGDSGAASLDAVCEPCRRALPAAWPRASVPAIPLGVMPSCPQSVSQRRKTCSSSSDLTSPAATGPAFSRSGMEVMNNGPSSGRSVGRPWEPRTSVASSEITSMR